MFQHKEFYVKITSENLIRQDEKESADYCDGFLIEILDAPDSPIPLELISAAVGYELSENSEDEAVEFAMEYIDGMAEVYRELIAEMQNGK